MSFAEQNQQTPKQWVEELLVEIRNEDVQLNKQEDILKNGNTE